VPGLEGLTPVPSPKVSLLTPTRDRPVQFRLCERWMARQSLEPFEWVVIDDGDSPAHLTLGQRHVRREPSAERCTLNENLRAGVREARGELVVVVEDDDWYHRDYLRFMVDLARGAELFGIGLNYYYNLPLHQFTRNANNRHASLCTSGWRGSREVRRWVERACVESRSQGSPFVDAFLWNRKRGYPGFVNDHQWFIGFRRRLHLALRPVLSLGIKGLGGRGGLGAGHDGSYDYRCSDPDRSFLRYVCGGEDAAALEGAKEELAALR
jgi:glycosyltransferase involved in cell wall biosynthesis